MTSALQGRSVHVWQIDAREHEADALLPLLTADETVRAGRFLRYEDRRNFILGRGLLRRLLGHYLQREAEQIRLCADQDGKPRLQDGAPLEFNLSHSGDRIVIGFSNAGAVGVDIEAMRPVPDYRRLARRLFSAAEQREIDHSEEAIKLATFFDIWTRKEAYVKMLGTGIDGDIALYDCRPGPGATLAISKGDVRVTTLRLVGHRPEPDYVSALVCDSLDANVAVFTLPAGGEVPDRDRWREMAETEGFEPSIRL
ncbi:4'-phosphopantetheinyl transferase family protein [Rhodoligotrophos appendicifer]|uniref:4'-phosphopantetheinyl transferase family protein n=1 Tax=Rhodoligotrophos appendicifer TaxID=987056 RepID=UPI0011862E15|nr:4'-phosphopantetheinyl transferase superfamily protein [Rhodoligotrophos appendicifer]